MVVVVYSVNIFRSRLVVRYSVGSISRPFKSFLNGNNGSWTNTDDHDQQRNRPEILGGQLGNPQHARRRINNRVRHANPAFDNGAGRNRQGEANEVVDNQLNQEQPEGNRQVVVVRVEKKIERFAVYEVGHPFSLVNELYIERIREGIDEAITAESKGVDQHGVVYTLVPPGFEDNQVMMIEPSGCAYHKEYSRQGPDAPWVIVDHPKNVCTRNTWQVYHFKRTHLYADFWAILPLHMVTKVFNLFRVSGETLESEAYRSTLRAYVFGPVFNNVPDLIKQQVVDCLISHRRRVGMTTKRMHSSDLSEIPTVTPELDLRDHFNTVYYTGIVNVQAVQFDIRNLGRFIKRDDVELEARGCHIHYVDEDNTLIDSEQSGFATALPAKVKSYVRWLGFRGRLNGFRMYDPSPGNVLAGAFKRMISARENDSELRANQGVFVLRAASYIYQLDHEVGQRDENPWGLGLPTRLKRLLEAMKIVHLAQGQLRDNVFRKQLRDAVCDRRVNYTQNKVFDAVWSNLMRRCSVGFYNSVFDCCHNSMNAIGDNVSVWTHSLIAQVSPWLGDLFYSRQHIAAMPHGKRALRQQMVDRVVVHNPEDVLVDHPQACGKIELAKGDPTKTMRIFVGYNAGAMYANELPEMVKRGMHGVNQGEYNGLTWYIYVFAKPSAYMFQDALDLYKVVVATPNSVAMVIYSDDSVLIVNVNGIIECFNVDISSCDSGNDFPIFALTGLLLGNFNEELAIGLIKQCCKPIELKNPHNPQEKLTIDFHGPFEGSGTVLTTLNNHLASVCIACELIVLLGDTINNGDNFVLDDAFIQPAANRAGHKVTLERNTVLGTHSPSFQFLKHSFGMSEQGVAVPYLNYGAIMRGIGSSLEPVDAKSLGLSLSEFKKLTLQERFERRTKGIINGLVNEPKSVIMDALFTRWQPLSWENQPEREYLRSITDGVDLSTYYITDEALCDCYHLLPEELSEIVRSILTIQVGELHLLDGMAKIFQKDYGLDSGLEVVEHETPLEHVVGFDQSARYRGALSSL
jgi:hypothetical protein